MDFNKTSVFNVQELRQELILMMINEVVEALEFKGYNATNQLVGYLTSGDLKYISDEYKARLYKVYPKLKEQFDIIFGS